MKLFKKRERNAEKFIAHPATAPLPGQKFLKTPDESESTVDENSKNGGKYICIAAKNSASAKINFGLSTLESNNYENCAANVEGVLRGIDIAYILEYDGPLDHEEKARDYRTACDLITQHIGTKRAKDVITSTDGSYAALYYLWKELRNCVLYDCTCTRGGHDDILTYEEFVKDDCAYCQIISDEITTYYPGWTRPSISDKESPKHRAESRVTERNPYGLVKMMIDTSHWMREFEFFLEPGMGHPLSILLPISNIPTDVFRYHRYSKLSFNEQGSSFSHK